MLRAEKQRRPCPFQTFCIPIGGGGLRDRLSLVLNRRGCLERIRACCGRDQTVPRGISGQPIPARRLCWGAWQGVSRHPPFLGILGDDPGARPGVGRLMPGGPSRGCWNEGRCYGNGRQGLGGEPRPELGPGGLAVAVAGRWRSAARPSAASTTRPPCFNTATVRPLLSSDPGPAQGWTYLLLPQPPPSKSPSSPLAEDSPFSPSRTLTPEQAP